MRTFLGRVATGSVIGRGTAIAEHRTLDDDARLREALWDPLVPHLADIDTVFVAPDSFLGTLPLEVLVDAQGRYLIERYGFVYLSDASALVRMAAEQERRPGLLVVGGVDYDVRDTGASAAGAPGRAANAGLLRGPMMRAWMDLPATDDEAAGILALHENAFGADAARTLLRASAATEERLKSEMPHHGTVHVATHGFFQAEDRPLLWDTASESELITRYHPGLLSGLVCAGANTESARDRDDGLLTAEEVGWLDLAGVDLISRLARPVSARPSRERAS